MGSGLRGQRNWDSGALLLRMQCDAAAAESSTEPQTATDTRASDPVAPPLTMCPHG